MLKNIAAIDVGFKNTAIAFWQEGQLSYFETFPAQNCQELDKNLKRLSDHFEKTTHVFVEQQMTSNGRAVKIEYQIYMWLHLSFPHIIFEAFSARKKYIFMDKAIYSTKTLRKKWACIFAKTLIPESMQNKFSQYKKQDDISDAIVIGHVVLNPKPKKGYKQPNNQPKSKE